MLRKSIRRGRIPFVLLLTLGLGMAGAAPATAQGFGPEKFWNWLADLFAWDLSVHPELSLAISPDAVPDGAVMPVDDQPDSGDVPQGPVMPVEDPRDGAS